MSLYLREANKSDIDLLYVLANDTLTRQNSFHSDPITYEEHKQWFSRMMADEREHPYILMDDDTPVGQIRLSCVADTAELDCSIAREYRGLGYGQSIFQLAVRKVKDEYPDICRLVAKVKPENAASAYCLEKNGFTEQYKQYILQINKEAPDSAFSEVGIERKNTGGGYCS